MFSLRRILAVSLTLMATVPALLAAWIIARGSSDAVGELAGRMLGQVADVVQAQTEAQLRQAHDVLNGLLAVRPADADMARMRNWLREPGRFEPMAFALARQAPNVPSVHIGNYRGEYLGVHVSADGIRVAHREAQGRGRRSYVASHPGDRSRPVDTEGASFEPRSTAWYGGALRARERVFSAVQVSPSRRQLMVSLSQPVFDTDGGAAGVLATDLYLQSLADALRTQRIGGRGAAFVIDEGGLLVASSAGDALFRQVAGRYERRTPLDSANGVIRAAHAALEQLKASRRRDSVAADTSLHRLSQGGETLLMVQRPFGETLGLRWTLVVAAPEADFTAGIDRAWQVSLAVMVLLVLLGVLAAFGMAHGLGRRLGRLSVAAGEIGQGRVPVIEHATRIREVHDLSRVMHDTAEQLHAYRQQVDADARALQEANDTLESRVEQRTAQLAASREEALAAARAKAAFLATMSHEIRTPLNGVLGMSALLMETPLDAEQRDFLQTIRLSGDQLLAVINDVLDFSKIESGKLELEIEPLGVRAAVEEACDIAATRARDKGLELIVDVQESGPEAVPPAILGDVTRLRQVLINLINNAVKFTEKGEVAVHVRRVPADRAASQVQGGGAPDAMLLEFRVTDTGIGIPAERVGSLFEAFTQVDVSTTRRYGGTGLGLAICKRLVALMGGRIGVDSRVGQGSAFWFTVQARACELEDPLAARGSMLGDVRVLVVDDHATNVRILTRQLQMWGMQVSSAASAQEALAALEAAGPGPDLLITDMHMPHMDGVQLARALRQDRRWAHLPMVLLSSGFMPSGSADAALFDARLLKPARQTQLFDALVRCTAPQEALHARAPAASGHRKHVTVLVADDNAVNLKVARAMVAKLGYEVVTARDGREAVAAVAAAVAAGERLGAVLMDVNMPELDGLDATRQIRATWGDRAPPVLALTAATAPEDRLRCEAAGMVDFLTKPLHVPALAQALERWAPADPASEASTDTGAGHARPAAPGELLDERRLAEFREFDDADLTMTRDVVALFLADGAARVAAIETALDAADAPALAHAAHALKGACSNIGALALAQSCAELEAQAASGDLTTAATRVAALPSTWEATRQAVQAWLDACPPATT